MEHRHATPVDVSGQGWRGYGDDGGAEQLDETAPHHHPGKERLSPSLSITVEEVYAG
jgi:hypothetical protein